MLNKKFLLGTILTAAVCLSACKKETELIDDFTTTAPPPQTVQNNAESTANGAAKNQDGLSDIVINPGGVNEYAEDVLDRNEEQQEAEEYFTSRGFEYNGNNGGDLTVDMAIFPGSDDPLADIDEKHLGYVFTVRLANGRDRSFDFLSKLKNLKTVNFLDDVGDTDLSFIADCENINLIWLQQKSGSIEKLAETVKNSGVKWLIIDTNEYSPEAANTIMKAVPACAVQYRYDPTPDFDWDKTTRSVALYTNLQVCSSAEEPQKWEEQDVDKTAYLASWTYHGSLVSTFTNFTEEDKTVTSVRIFREDGDSVTEMPFADGSTLKNIELAVKAGEKADFDISEDIFPFTACGSGVYKIEFECGGEKLVQSFAINNSGINYETVASYTEVWKDRTLYGSRQADDGTNSITAPGFLDDEQREAFKSAFVITSLCFGSSGMLPDDYFDSHTEEEFYSVYCKGYTRDFARSKLEYYGFLDENGKLCTHLWDGGGDPTYAGEVFVPIYSDENEALFKAVIIHCHDSSPYKIEFEERNFHMVNTEDGWKFDNFTYLG